MNCFVIRQSNDCHPRRTEPRWTGGRLISGLDMSLAPRKLARYRMVIRRIGVGLSSLLLFVLCSGLFPVKSGNVFTVVNTNDSGPGSLRQAIVDANASPGLDTITFNIPGSGVRTITPVIGFDLISDAVIIDGTTQPGYAGTPLIELSGFGSAAVGGLVVTGGNSTIRGLRIVSFSANGILLIGNGGNKVEDCFVGLDAAGLHAQGNGNGIEVVSSNNMIGGTTPEKRNIISGNSLAGIYVVVAGNNGTTSGNAIQGNYIGTTSDGNFGIPNARQGICLCSNAPDQNVTNNQIGGNTPGARNLISYNLGAGISISGFYATNNIVQGNYIGTNAAGTQSLPNEYGVYIDAGRNNVIGGTAPGAGNLISGNMPTFFGEGGYGIALWGDNNSVQGNLIGTDATGTLPVPNGTMGISISRSNNSVGGLASGAGNVVAFNGVSFNIHYPGIAVTALPAFRVGAVPTGNQIIGNSVYANTGLGIDIGYDGITSEVTPNDPGDADSGANNLQNFPVITSALSTSSATTIFGTFNSAPNTAFLLEFFANDACDPSGNGEGQTPIGNASVATDAGGNVSFNVLVPFSLGTKFVTATATDPDGNSSEFSSCLQATGANASTLQFAASNYSVNEGCTAVNITVTRSGDSSALATVDYATSDASANQRADYTSMSGTLTFASGETSKTFPVLISKDAYLEGNETVNLVLGNASNGIILGPLSHAMLTVIDDPTVSANSQPLDDARTFVGEHYHDFLAREPDQAGLDYWSGQLVQCGNDANCLRSKRVDVSNAFFYELEFQQTGAYVYRLYRAAFGNNQPLPNPDNSNQSEAKKLPAYSAFAADRARVVGGASLLQGQLDFAKAFVQRPEFVARYALSLDGPAFVNAVLATIKDDLGVDLTPQSNALVDLYNTSGRAGVLYHLADDNSQTNIINNREFIDAEYNRAFVATEYFGYLRRDPDIAGFLFWLGQVNSAALHDLSKQHAMVCSFLTSREYQQRFSAAVTHFNSECQ